MGPFWLHNSFFLPKPLYIQNICCTFAPNLEERKLTMKVIKYKNSEERLEAVRRMISLRKVFEDRVREISASKKDLQIVR